MKDHVWSGLVDHAPRQFAARNVHEVHAKLAATKPVSGSHLQFPLELIERALCSVSEDQLTRSDRKQLTRELRADRPCGTGDHDDTVAHEIAHGRAAVSSLGPAQEIL